MIGVSMFHKNSIRRASVLLLSVAVMFVAAGCHNNRAPNPIANLDSKQPDKVLFDRAMEAMRNNKFDTARITLQTLINTYPDSEYIARAKLAVGDSWYAEGSSAALQQAEVEYKDFETFFPNMAEAAEAQLKVAGIHYKQMEKPDRDYTHAKRAEDEYRQLIQQYPDSKLVPEAKQRLREVQEVLAEREFRVGRFYALRDSYPAAIARLKSMIDTYPLYSGADDALFLLGQTYQAQAEVVRGTGTNQEAAKAGLIRRIEDQAALAYARIITRYPACGRKDDAIAKLKSMNRPVPTPTPEAIAQSKAEEESRSESTRMTRIMGNFRRGPDVAHAAKTGEPTLEDAKPTNAPDVVKTAIQMAFEEGSKASVETVKPGTGTTGVPHSETAPPKSDNPPATAPNTVGVAEQPADKAGSNDSTSTAPMPPPAQVNDAKADSGTSTTADTKTADKADSKDDSTSKKKKKKGLRKLIPF